MCRSGMGVNVTDLDDVQTVDAVLRAYERFRAADAAMLVRVRTQTGLGENELAILRFLLSERASAHDVKPSEIARHLGVSSASTTALLDRLEKAGMVVRASNPGDRRSIFIEATADAEHAIASTYEVFEGRLASLMDGMSAEERRDVIAFFSSLADAADATAELTPTR